MTVFATERNWDENIVLSTVQLRYKTTVFRAAFVLLARNAKHIYNYLFRIVCAVGDILFDM